MMQISDRTFLTMASLALNKINGCQNIFSDLSLAYNIMMLENNDYSNFWFCFSTFSGIPVLQLKTHFSLLSQQVFTPNFQINEESFKFRKSVNRSQSKSVVQFRSEFTHALVQVLGEQFKTDLNKSSEKEICLFLNANVKMSDKTAFWKEVAQYINGKTNKQIQDYYCHSYQNVIYDRQLSTQDKNILRYLNEFWQDQRPVFVADKFLEMTSEKDYFKHNIINVRR
ncbi:SANT/Myb_domain [Hexamita inflata]|uniref:SANT/Myb domain n=1 Tax=Hexamita inflata TaxID=28002 RepID=A0AA86NHB3_9EUKA|nr:SANT/Myb domain [Hexamita inflata]